MTDSGKWLLLTPDNEVAGIEVSPEKSPRDYAVSLPGPHAREVYSHLVHTGVWMVYCVYNEGEEPDVNHCASVLWNFKDPASKPHMVYGPVVMTGSITHRALTDDNFARIALLARLARVETENLKRVE